LQIIARLSNPPSADPEYPACAEPWLKNQWLYERDAVILALLS